MMSLSCSFKRLCIKFIRQLTYRDLIVPIHCGHVLPCIQDKFLSGLDLSGVRALLLDLHPTMVSKKAEVRIYQVCAVLGLYLRVDFSSAHIVAFEAA